MIWPPKIFTRPNVATLLMLGGGIMMTIGGAAALYLLAYQPMPGPESAAIERIHGIASMGILYNAFAGCVLVVLGLIVLNIDRMSASGAGFSVELDRADPPPVTATATVTVASSTEGAK